MTYVTQRANSFTLHPKGDDAGTSFLHLSLYVHLQHALWKFFFDVPYGLYIVYGCVYVHVHTHNGGGGGSLLKGGSTGGGQVSFDDI